MECFSFLAEEKGGCRWAEGRGRRECDRLWKGTCGGEGFFRIWGTRRVFVRMSETKRATVSPLFKVT